MIIVQSWYNETLTKRRATEKAVDKMKTKRKDTESAANIHENSIDASRAVPPGYWHLTPYTGKARFFCLFNGNCLKASHL